MVLINEEKVKNESEKYLTYNYDSENCDLSTAVIHGASFAETELQNLAIEFAEYIKFECYISTSDEWYMPTGKGDVVCTTSELFANFIKQRKIN